MQSSTKLFFLFRQLSIKVRLFRTRYYPDLLVCILAQGFKHLVSTFYGKSLQLCAIEYLFMGLLLSGELQAIMISCCQGWGQESVHQFKGAARVAEQDRLGISFKAGVPTRPTGSHSTLTQPQIGSPASRRLRAQPSRPDLSAPMSSPSSPAQQKNYPSSSLSRWERGSVRQM